ncbi:T9SS type A sorting domain-containing protein [bacterium]|nr:T9SS type A sorting domain-containing protein [bacterium]
MRISSTILLIICLSIFSSTLLAQTTEILIGGEGTELSPDGVISGNGCLSWGGQGAAVLDTFNIYYQPLGEGDFQDNLFPDPEVYSFQMNIPDGLRNFQSHGIHGSFWNSHGREGEGALPWINENWRGGQYYDARYRPTGEAQYYGVVSDTVHWTIDYWDVNDDEEICFIHTCLAGMVEDFTYDENTGNAIALLKILNTVYLGYGDDGEPGPGTVEYNGGTYQGFDSFREPSGLLDYPAFFFQYDGESNTGSMTPCEGKVRVIGEGGLTKGYFDVIQDGIDAAEDGDTVLVSPGTYEENISFAGKAILVEGCPEAPSEVIIDAGGNGSVVTFANGEEETSVLSGFTLMNGNGNFGGGVNAQGTSPMLENLIVRDNNANLGGGLASTSEGNPTITNSLFEGNTAGTNGGTITAWRSGVIMRDVTIIGDPDNEPSMGGGVYISAGTGTFEDVTVHGCRASLGAAFSLWTSEITLTRVVAFDNSAANGGAFYLNGGSTVMDHLTICNNNANEGAPGNIFSSSTDINLTNSVFFNNSGDQRSIILHHGDVVISYCDIENGQDGIEVDEANLNWGDGNIDEDPQFADPDNGDFHLTEDSPCIDAGDPDSPEDPDETRADMGAYYFHQIGRFIDVPGDFETIQDAVGAAEAGDTVLVHPGTYTENVGVWNEGIIIGSLYITSGEEQYIEETIVDGGGDWAVFDLGWCDRLPRDQDPVVLNGLTIQNGGFGIYCRGAFLRVESCVIRDNHGEDEGAGVFLTHGTELALINCKIIDNTAFNGAGIYCCDPAPKIIGCIIANNVAQRGGGMFIADGAMPLIKNSCFTGNSALIGGAIWSQFSNPLILNSTFYGNESEYGAGIQCNYPTSANIINSILWNNEPAEIMLVAEGEGEIQFAYNDIEGGEDGIQIEDFGDVHWLDGNVVENPFFVDPDNGDFHLTEDSPCIDAGTAFFVWEGDTLINMSEDEYMGNAPDMGAYESEFSDVDTDQTGIPNEFALHQNYPNPFNSTTSLRFDLPLTGNAKLVIYDINGREIAKIVDGSFAVGRYTAVLNAQNLPSGIYLAKLETTKATKVVKLMLIR